MRLRAHVLPFALLLAGTCADAGAHAAQDTAPASAPVATPAFRAASVTLRVSSTVWASGFSQ